MSEYVEHAVGDVLFAATKESVLNDFTFDEPAFLMRISAVAEKQPRPRMTLPLRSCFAAGDEVLRAFLTLVQVSQALHGTVWRNSGSYPSAEMIVAASSGITRHGWATVAFDGRRCVTPFVDGWGFYALFEPGDPRPSLEELRDIIRPPDRFRDARTPFQTRRVTSSMHMKESWAPWEGGWPFSGTLGNLAALLDPTTHQGIDDFKELIHLLRVDIGTFNVGTGDTCISELRIHSHGNKTKICMGDDKITDADFQANGMVNPGTKLEELFKVLKKVMCKPSKIIFDACNAAQGTLLQNISKNLGPDITVNGCSGTGNPITEGDTNYKGGVKL